MSTEAWAWMGCVGWFIVALVQRAKIGRLERELRHVGQIALSLMGSKP